MRQIVMRPSLVDQEKKKIGNNNAFNRSKF